MSRFKSIEYTIKHRKAFRTVEKELYHKVSFRGYIHDLDKVVLYFLLGKELTSKIHKNLARHHIKRAKTEKDFKEMLVDWECARFTKPDKPLNAYDTLYTHYPELESKILPLLKEVNLVK